MRGGSKGGIMSGRNVSRIIFLRKFGNLEKHGE
jgi:hypothetical protein